MTFPEKYRPTIISLGFPLEYLECGRDARNYLQNWFQGCRELTGPQISLLQELSDLEPEDKVVPQKKLDRQRGKRISKKRNNL
jgi:hypothetical protein